MTAYRLPPFDQHEADKRNALRLAAAERMAQALGQLEDCNSDGIHAALQACRVARAEWEALK